MVDRNAEVLAEQLLTWPTADRARLAALLLASIEPSEPDITAAWDEEIARRGSELDAGRVPAIPVDDVFAALDRRLQR
jgi:putative addiction module component (TIGR02574 family)